MADVWLSAGDCRLSDLLEVTSTPTVLTDYPHASEVVDGVVVYEREHIGDALVGVEEPVSPRPPG